MLRYHLPACIVTIALCAMTVVWADDQPFEFADPKLDARFDRLIEELRCLVCQNQSLADSNAELAQDLRGEVFRLLHEGNADDDIIDYLVERYGDFVLYRPPLKSTTWLLWLGPAAMVLIGAIFILRLTKTKSERRAESLSEEERAALERLSDQHDHKS